MNQHSVSSENYPHAGAYVRQWRKVVEMALFAPSSMQLRRNPFAYKTAREFREEESGVAAG